MNENLKTENRKNLETANIIMSTEEEHFLGFDLSTQKVSSNIANESYNEKTPTMQVNQWLKQVVIVVKCKQSSLSTHQTYII